MPSKKKRDMSTSDECVDSALIVAAKESHVFLHVAEALRALHRIWNLSNSAGELEAAAGASIWTKIIMVVRASHIETL